MRPPALWEDHTAADRVKTTLPVSIALHFLILGMYLFFNDYPLWGLSVASLSVVTMALATAINVVIAEPKRFALAAGGFFAVLVFGAGFIAVAILVSIFLPARSLAPPSYEVTLIAPIRKGTPGGGAAAVAVRTPGAAGTPVPVATTAPKIKDNSLTQPTKAESHEELIARLKKEAALHRLAAEHAATSGTANPKGTPEPEPTKLAAANPVGTPGGTGSGAGTGNGGVEYGTWDGLPGSATYEQQIQAIVRQAWDPVLLDEKPWQCVIRVFIDLDGTIVTRSIETPSGNPSFDASGNVALIKVSKFPPPPPELKLYLLHKGIPLRFDSRDRVE